MRLLAAVLLAIAAVPVCADETVTLCYNYGCAARSAVHYEEEALNALDRHLRAAGSAAEERDALARAVGALYRIAAMQTPVGADRGGNLRDAGVSGRMDCIDHSTSTTALLELLAARGSLRYHKVLAPARRTRFVLLQHFSAVIEETAGPAPLAAAVEVPDHVGLLLFYCDCPDVLGDIPRPPAPPPGNPGGRFAVDSWFVDNGEPAVILPLADWLNGGGPNVQ